LLQKLKPVSYDKLSFVLELISQVAFWNIQLSPKIKSDLNTTLQCNFKACGKTQFCRYS